MVGNLNWPIWSDLWEGSSYVNFRAWGPSSNTIIGEDIIYSLISVIPEGRVVVSHIY